MGLESVVLALGSALGFVIIADIDYFKWSHAAIRIRAVALVRACGAPALASGAAAAAAADTHNCAAV